MARAQAVRTGGGQTGDDLILTGGIAIEGTAVLAREAGPHLTAREVRGGRARASDYLFTPGISVVRAAQVLWRRPSHGVHSLHDPTEGGITAGVWEVAEASGTGATVQAAAVTVLPETRAVCDALELDPYGLLASGALLHRRRP